METLFKYFSAFKNKSNANSGLKEHFPFLDAIRYFAALTVMISHYHIFVSATAFAEYVSIIAVEVFFVLSGFVLATQINLICTSNEKQTFLKIFLLRRWIRTVPSYVIALLSAAIIFGFGDVRNFLTHLFYLQNFVSDNPSFSFFSVGWSLSVEEWFYILFPISLILYQRIRCSTNSRLLFAISFLVFFALLRALYDVEENWGAEVRRSVIFRLDAIVYGYIAFITKDHFRLGSSFVVFLIMLVIFSVFSSHYLSLPSNFWMQNIFPILSGILFGNLMIILSKFNGMHFNLIGKFFEFLARLSYPIYLFHLIAIGIMSKFEASNIWVYVAALHIFAIIFHFGFEYQLLIHRPKYPNNTK